MASLSQGDGDDTLTVQYIPELILMPEYRDLSLENDGQCRDCRRHRAATVLFQFLEPAGIPTRLPLYLWLVVQDRIQQRIMYLNFSVVADEA
jgi:hypothetical protein